MTTSLVSKFALIVAVGAFTAACSNFSEFYSETTGSDGMSGFKAYSKGDYKKANQIFAEQYQKDQDDRYALLNLADSYSALGDREHAIPLYQKLAATGKNEHPEYYDPKPNKNPTFTDMACYHLKELQVADPNCP